MQDNFEKVDAVKTNFCDKLIEFGHYFLFALFMNIVESFDVSCLHIFVMRAIYVQKAVVVGAMFGHILMNLLVVLVCFTIFPLFDDKSVKLFGCLSIYFIITYELMHAILSNMELFLEA